MQSFEVVQTYYVCAKKQRIFLHIIHIFTTFAAKLGQ